MKICIYGAGAIGALVGARLAAAGGHEVSAISRGATLTALKEHGWRVRSPAGPLQQAVVAVHDTRELGVQDLVIIAVKGPALVEAAARLSPLVGPNTVVMPAMNGVPWWFVQGQGALGAQPLQSVDPGGVLGRAIPFEQLLGCVVHVSSSMPEPGLVDHKVGERLIVGEPAGGFSERAGRVVELLSNAGFAAEESSNIRQDIWYKLWGNLTMNPVSAITGATIDRILDDPLVLEFCSNAMREAAAVGARIGCTIADSPDDRHVLTRKLGAFKSSMLQDVEAGRAIELDAIVSVVKELGERVSVDTPNIDALLGLTRLYARVHGLYPA